MKGTIVIGGSVAQKPHHGGHTWVFLQYLLGFRRLGWDVLLLDRLEPAMSRDAAGRPCAPADSISYEFFRALLERFELTGVLLSGNETIGLSRPELLERVGRAALLLNVMGFIEDAEILGRAPRRVFLDIDPGFPQIWHAQGLAQMFDGHDDFVTIGENLGRPNCEIPTCGLSWITTPQPVVLDQWPVAPDPGDAPITSIASWRGAYGTLTWRGRTFGPRAHEFRRFVSLPRRCRETFELALDIDPGDHRDRELLEANGWGLSDPRTIAGDIDAYRAAIGRSRAEFMVAKNLYVATRGGWFSDRSICYLASGRPVLAQDTGLAGHYPAGEGLLLYSDLEGAVAAVDALGADYPSHARAARALAEEYFDSDRVLGRLLDELGVA